MKAVKLIFSFLLSALITINLVLLQFSFFTDRIFYNYNFYINKFEKFQFYNYVQDVAKENLGNLAKNYNLPENIFSSIITLDYVKLQIQNATKGSLNYMTYKTNTLPYINMSSEVNKTQSNFGSNTTNVVDIISVINSKNFQTMRAAFYKLFLYKDFLTSTLIILIFILLIIGKRDTFPSLVWISCSFIAGGILTLMASLISISSSFVNNINLGASSLNLMILSILRDYIRYFLDFGGVLTAIGVLSLIITLVGKKISTKKNYKNRV